MVASECVFERVTLRRPARTSRGDVGHGAADFDPDAVTAAELSIGPAAELFLPIAKEAGT